MNTDVKSVQKMLKKAKRKRFLITAGIVFVLLSIILVGREYIENRMVESKTITASLRIQEFTYISTPGVTEDSKLDEVIGNKGTTSTTFTKNIDGYHLKWGKIDQSVSCFKTGQVINTVNQIAVQQNKNQSYVYNPTNNQKVAIFYQSDENNMAGKKMEQDLERMSEIKNSVAEVALSIDKPYTYKEILKMLPDNFIPSFYWVYAPKLNESNGTLSYMPIGVNSIDFESGTLTEDNWKNFYQAATKFDANNEISNDLGKNCEQITKAYKGKKLDDAKFAGVLISGKTENFKLLKGKSWIKASSGGAVIQCTSLIEPTK